MQGKKYIWFDKKEIISARTMLEYFLQENIYIEGFVSESEESIGIYLLNKKIFSIHEIDRENSCIFTEKEVDGHPEFHCISEKKNEKVMLDDKEYFAIQNVGWMREIVKGRKLFLCDFSARSRKLAEIYTLLDFNVEGYIDEDVLEYPEGERVIGIEEIVYEDNFFILINRDFYRNKVERFKDLGLSMLTDMGIDNPFGTWYLGTGNQILDVSLGHSFLGNQGICGFDVFGGNAAEDFKIVVLGGSTTDESLFPFKSWAQLLFEKIGRKDVTIFNGGVVGYTSSHEMLKLLRDVFFIRPGMVIVYDGFNDMAAQSGQNPFAFSDMQKIVNYADQHKSKLWLDFFMEGLEPYAGIKPDIDKFDIWLNNIRRMKVICESEGINFYSFLQPVLYSKLNRTKEEEGLIWSTWRIYNCYDWANEFRSRIKKTADSEELVYDLSHIFDAESDVYMDDCHVYEKGNKMIAECVYEIIKNKLKER